MTIPQPPYIYATQAEAEAASNALYLAQNPAGTTELLYGWVINAAGQYQLAAPDSSVVTAPVAPATAPTVSDYTIAVQALLDSKACERNYDGILSACTYATSANAKFAAEGKACIAWRDACWSYCYQALADVQAGKRAAPTIPDLLAELPALAWPD